MGEFNPAIIITCIGLVVTAVLSKKNVKGSILIGIVISSLLAWGFALPFAVIFCVFMLIPLISSMAMSFTDITSRDLRTPFNVNFVGLDQYIALFSDKRFLHSLGVTGISYSSVCRSP